MGTTIPFAFSVHHFISSVGADAGFAAIIGLAILVLLYFAQARETANLRDRAEDAAAHLEELEIRLAQLSRGGVGSATGTIPPTPAPPGLARPAVAAAPVIAAARTGSAAPVAARTAAPQAAPTVQAGAPAAPAGVGAPALSAATRLIPDPEREAVAFHANGVPASGAAAVLSPSPPPPSTAAGGANGSSGPGAGAGGSGSAPVGATTAEASQIARPPARPAGRAAPPPRRPAAPGRAGAPGGGSRISRGLIAAITVLGVAAVVVVLLVVTSTSSSNHTSSTATSQTTNAQTAQHRTHRATGVVKPASVTVAVLNGTSTSNLAHTVAQQLGTAGFKEGSIATATDQTQTATVVGYMPGHRSDALIVAKSLKLGSASVQPVDQSNKTVACPASSTPCTAQVVVTVGSDLANS